MTEKKEISNKADNINNKKPNHNPLPYKHCYMTPAYYLWDYVYIQKYCKH